MLEKFKEEKMKEDNICGNCGSPILYGSYHITFKRGECTEDWDYGKKVIKQDTKEKEEETYLEFIASAVQWLKRELERKAMIGNLKEWNGKAYHKTTVDNLIDYAFSDVVDKKKD